MSELTVDRNAFQVSALDGDDSGERSFWLSKTPEERLQALELNRRIVYGYLHTAPRLQRFFEIAEFETS